MTTARTGWLAEQLPRCLAEDDFLRRFVGIFEELADGYRSRADGFGNQLDPGIAAPEFVRWTAGWLGLQLDVGLDEARQRAVVKAAGELFPWRGTTHGLRGILEAMTGDSVSIEDGGGVYAKDKAPENRHTVTITLTSASDLNEQRLLEMIRDEVPADAAVVLRVGKRVVQEEEQQAATPAKKKETAPSEAAPPAAADAGRSAGSPDASERTRGAKGIEDIGDTGDTDSGTDADTDTGETS